MRFTPQDQEEDQGQDQVQQEMAAPEDEFQVPQDNDQDEDQDEEGDDEVQGQVQGDLIDDPAVLMQMHNVQAGVPFQAHQVQGQVQNQVQGQGPQVGFRIITSPWQGDLDLSTKAGKALWDEGIKPVENKFSGMGKDLVRFLADVQNRINKCRWHDIINIEGRSLVKRYGEITKEQVTGARDRRNNRAIATLQDARPIINAQMMYHFIYDSLGTIPQKKISTRLDDIQQDGPTLLKTVLDDTFVATQASTFTIKEKFYNLNLKKYKWNVQLLNQDVGPGGCRSCFR